MLGTDYGTNTSIHLAEYRADIPTERTKTRAPVRRNGERVTVTCKDIETTTDDFEQVGAAFERAVDVECGPAGEAKAALLDQSQLVDLATEWLEKNRG